MHFSFLTVKHAFLSIYLTDQGKKLRIQQIEYYKKWIEWIYIESCKQQL